MHTLKDQPVLILGLGVSGLAMARWCARQGAQVTVADTREAPPQRTALQAEVPQARFIAGPLEAALLNLNDATQTVRAVFKSPGLTPASVALIFEAALQHGISTGGELSLFAVALKALANPAEGVPAYVPKVLAITGTNGKTTVTSLTGHLIERAGKTVAIAGNIGPTLLDTLTECLNADTLPEVWVLELSSFQLQDAGDFEPTAGTVLNVTQDHLDWHGDIAAYAAAKARVFGRNATMLLNREDPLVMAMRPVPVKPVRVAKSVPVQGEKGESIPFTVKPVLARNILFFGGDMPQRPSDFGMEVVNGMAWLVRAHEADETRKTRRQRQDEPEALYLQRLMPADALRIRGRHNATNALAALALTAAAGCAIGPALYALREYRGEPHRVESVAIVNEVEYVDDSKGTNVGATVAALNGLGEDLDGGFAGERRLWVILGGDGKGQDFSPLAAPVARHVRGVVLTGRDAHQIREALALTGVELIDVATLPEAVQLCSRRAQPGDAVLLSPACASIDLFDNYVHRARVFCDAVQDLEASA